MKKIIAAILCVITVALQLSVVSAEQAAAIERIIAVGCNGNVSLSWYNNNMDNVAKIELYNESNVRLASTSANPKNGVTVSGTTNNRIPKINGSTVHINIPNLTSGVKYKYSVKITSNDAQVNTLNFESTKLSADYGMPTGWRTEYSGNALSKAEKVSSEDAAVGSYVLCVLSNADAENAQKIIPELATPLETGKKYRFEFYAKGNGTNSLDICSETVNINSSTWKKYSADFEYDQAVPSITVKDICEGVYLDWVTCRELDDNGNIIGNNLLTDGNFEQTSGDDDGSTGIKNIIAVGRDSSFSVSWINPSRDDISKIEVTDETGSIVGESGNGDILLSSGAYNHISVRAENGSRHKCTLKIKYKDGSSSVTQVLSNVLNDAGQMLWGAPVGVQNISGWKEAVNAQLYTKLTQTAKDKHSGEAALLVRAYLDAPLSNTYMRFGPDLKEELKADGKYLFSYWRKGKNVKALKTVIADNDITDTVGNSDWQEIKHTFTGNYLPLFKFETGMEELYIDDVCLYELDEDDNIIGENLLVNGGFEDGFDKTTAGEVSDVVYTTKLDTGKITWSGEPQEAEYILVYNKYGNEEFLRAIVLKGVKEVELDADAAPEVILKTMTASGTESQGIAAVSTPAALEIAAPIVKINGEIAESLSAGTINITRKIKNNAQSDDTTAVMIAGIYEGDLLKQYKVCSKLLPKTGNAVTYTLELNLDAVGEKIALKIFTWDSMTSRRSMAEPIILK